MVNLMLCIFHHNFKINNFNNYTVSKDHFSEGGGPLPTTTVNIHPASPEPDNLEELVPLFGIYHGILRLLMHSRHT